MKKRVSDYIVDFFYKNGIDTLFTITGGFAMHLNDSFGIHKNYNIYLIIDISIMLNFQIV